MSILIISRDQNNASKGFLEHINKIENVGINSLLNQDIIILGESVNGLSTKDIREVLNQSVIRPQVMTKKYLIVYNYNRVGERIQNMLLKTIEEGRITVLLHATNPANILPTTLSRVQVINNIDIAPRENKKKYKSLIDGLVENGEIEKVWKVDKEDLEEFLNELEIYLKNNKPKNYSKAAKKLFVLKKRLAEGIALNKDIQLTNLVIDLL